jgi:hypothetical protein
VTDLANRSAGIRAKLIAGLAYFGGFVPVFLAIRLHLAGVCKRQECYDGVQVALGKDAVRASVYNLLSAVPGSGGNELRVQLLEVGWDRVYPVDPTAWSMLLGLGALVALLALWWTVPHARYAGGVGLPDPRSTERAEGVVLGLAAGLSLLVALGTAIIMGISPRSHELVTEPGVLYRNAVVTWTGLVFGVVLAVLALGKILPRPGGPAAWATLAVAIALVGTLALPGNLLALRANRVLLEVSEAINWEVVRGDTAPGGDERRCDLFERARLGVGGTGSRDRLYTHANTAFKTHYGQPFCSRPGFPEDPQ